MVIMERESIKRCEAEMSTVGTAADSNVRRGPISVLAVSAHLDDHLHLREFLDSAQWKVHAAHNYREALKMLCFHQMPVVICESVLPDGNWIDILSETAPLMDSPRLIVASNHADAPDDRLRARVLNLGGFDVVSKPFDRNEVIRVVTVAWRNWEKDWSSHATYALPLTA